MKKSNNSKYPEVLPFSYRTEPNYFYAFIGPIDRDKLDEMCPGGEGLLRATLKNAYRSKFGEEKTCSSGWGVTPQQKDDARYALYDDELKKSLIKSYYDEKKPIPRALRAWELLFQEEDAKPSKRIDKTIKSRKTLRT